MNINLLVLYLRVQKLRGMINELQQEEIIFYLHQLRELHSKCRDNIFVSFNTM